MDASDGAGSTTVDYGEDDGSVTVSFSFAFNAAKCAVWWSLFLLALLYAFLRRRTVSRAWFIFSMLLSVILFNSLQTSAFVVYASHALKGHDNYLFAYVIYIFFFNVSRSSFLAVLLIVASGYCITRRNLGPHKGQVVFVPTAVLVTGLVTDYSFLALQHGKSSAGVYSLQSSDPVTAGVWFVCSVLNLAALILAWLYIFEALTKETAALEEERQLRKGGREERGSGPDAEATGPVTISGYAALSANPENRNGRAPGAQQSSATAVDAESGDAGQDDGGETVADHLAYHAKKTLLSRFAVGVAAYLIADICVLMLPAFMNHIVQSTLQVLLFVCYVIFVFVLLVLFRPQEQSSYLVVGFSEEDAEARGVDNLLTGVAMVSLGGHSSADDELSRPAGATTATSTIGSAPLPSHVTPAVPAPGAAKDTAYGKQLYKPAAEKEVMETVPLTSRPLGSQPRQYVFRPASAEKNQFTID